MNATATMPTTTTMSANADAVLRTIGLTAGILAMTVLLAISATL